MTESGVSLWSLGPSLYLPSFLYSTGQGAVLPVLALTALDLGAGFSGASAVMAVLGLGRVGAAIPAGSLAARIGERNAMLVAVAVTAVAMVGCILSRHIVVFAAMAFLLGCGIAGWSLARLAFVADTMPFETRGRALSLLGGIGRAGTLVGPFTAALVIAQVGTSGTYWLHLVLSITAGSLLLRSRTLVKERVAPSEEIGLFSVWRQHIGVFATLGTAAMLLASARAGRQLLIPLWSDHLGFDAVTTTIIVGVSAVADVVLFYPGGVLMDRFGRAAVGIPALCLMGAAYAMLPLTTTEVTLTTVALLLGVANGLTSGFNMVMGADASPSEGRAKFLGVWRSNSDLGDVVGPLAIGVITAAFSLAVSIVSMGVATWLAAAAVWRWLPRTRPNEI